MRSRCCRGVASKRDGNAAANLRHVLDQISPENLAREVLCSIDDARVSFCLNSNTVSSADDFTTIVSSFYTQLLRKTCSMERPSQWKDVGPEANVLLESAFAREGGRNEALSMAMTGIKGGMRRVLDMMTDQYRRQREKAYVDAVIAEAIDPLDWESKTAFVRELLAKNQGLLPPELANEPVARFADKCAELVRAYAAATSHVTAFLRST